MPLVALRARYSDDATRYDVFVATSTARISRARDWWARWYRITGRSLRSPTLNAAPSPWRVTATSSVAGTAGGAGALHAVTPPSLKMPGNGDNGQPPAASTWTSW